MMKFREPYKFKILIFILVGLAVFQAVSMGILLYKNARLQKALAAKRIPRAAILPKKAAAPAAFAGKAAIVIDDWGYNKRNLKALFGLGQPVTISILPNLPFSKTIGNEARANNVEVILHLPLEAHNSQKRPEKGAIYTYMNEREVLERLQAAFDSAPNITGVSNHMGSKATEDRKLMKLLFTQFKKRNLYFLDSLVTNDSVCPEIAANAGIKFAERSVFLDNNNDIEYIKGQLRQLLAMAKERKSAIGIGHDRPLTIKAVREMLPEFQREGVKLVYLSELVK